ncbi:MAG: MurT ligase domain-containing protein [Acidobacteriota bacterium]
MRQTVTTILGKGVRKLAQARGGGSALPGLFVEKIDPNFIKRTLADLPHGIVLISGTNGKTTTTKMVVELLEGQGLKVFTNRTGSNFTRGVAAALLGEVDVKGKLDADIAVLELDEAHAVHFVRAIPPTYSLLLNVMRDQLDRFGEIDKTAALLHTIAVTTTAGVVINRDDPRLATENFLRDINTPVTSFSVTPKLRSLFPSDDAMRGSGDNPKSTIVHQDNTRLESIEGQHATITFAGRTHKTELKLKGIYNVQNAVGAVALVRMIMGNELDETQMMGSLANVTPAFGRGETLTVDGLPCELVLVKNPSGFRLSLKSFDPSGYATMIAINDNYADGRDMSWLWDVDFDSLRAEGVAMITGVRAYDMALRMQYEEVEVSTVEPDIKQALEQFISGGSDKPKRIYCTYTAMLTLRRELAKRTNVETVR